MERDGLDDARDDELETERDLRDAQCLDSGWRECDDPRSLVHGVREESLLERDRDYEYWPKGLKERAYKDAALLSKIRGFQPDVWQSATPEQRLETLREAERQLAWFQG